MEIAICKSQRRQANTDLHAVAADVDELIESTAGNATAAIVQSSRAGGGLFEGREAESEVRPARLG